MWVSLHPQHSNSQASRSQESEYQSTYRIPQIKRHLIF